MVDGVYAAEQVGEQIAIAGVALVEVDLGTRYAGPPVAVYRRSQRVEDDDVMSE